MGKKGVRLFVCCLFAFGFSVGLSVKTLNAQVLYGSILGTVKDQTGAVVPGAQVVVTNLLNGFKREALSDEAGLYTIPNLPQAAYDLTVSASGFKSLTQTGVQVKVGSITRIDLSLEVGAL